MRTIKILGRNVPLAILAILMCGAVASATLAIYFSIRGRVDVTERTPVIAEPSSYVVDMAQGEVTYQSIIIINRSDLPQPIELVTTITGIGEGPEGEELTPWELTVTYPLADNMLTLEPNEEVPIEVAIEASWSIVPGTYAVRTNIVQAKPCDWIEPTFYTSESVGDVWPVPLTGTWSISASCDSYSDEIHVNTDEQNLGAFTFKIDYDPSIIMPTIVTGPDDWTIIPNFDNVENGLFTVGGFTAAAPVQGDDVLLLTISWNCMGTGTTVLSIDVETLGDYVTGENVGTPNGIYGERTIVE